MSALRATTYGPIEERTRQRLFLFISDWIWFWIWNRLGSALVLPVMEPLSLHSHGHKSFDATKSSTLLLDHVRIVPPTHSVDHVQWLPVDSAIESFFSAITYISLISSFCHSFCFLINDIKRTNIRSELLEFVYISHMYLFPFKRSEVVWASDNDTARAKWNDDGRYGLFMTSSRHKGERYVVAKKKLYRKTRGGNWHLWEKLAEVGRWNYLEIVVDMG